MRNKKSLLFLSIPLALSLVIFGEFTHEPKELFATPAYSYTNSPTNEPKYKDVTSFGTAGSYSQKTATYNRINVESTWSSYRGEKVKVAIIDTGCNISHEEFNGTIISPKSYDVASKTVGTSKIGDTSGHGTDTAACVAAAINNVGGTGIAPNVELYIIRAVNTSNSFPEDYVKDALKYCLKEHVDIINMSLQVYETTFTYEYVEDMNGQTYSNTITGGWSKSRWQTEINACYNAGITLIAAAGNYNTSVKSYPAANDHVISVGSTGLNNATNKAGFSNHGDWVDLVAPGYVIVPGKESNTSYIPNLGTSFSSPIVAGAAALYKSKYPLATPDEIEQKLKDSCSDVDFSGSGSGQIDVGAFLNDGTAEDWIDVTGITLNDSAVAVGNTKTLLPDFVPSNATRKTCYWSSSDTSVATVDANGVVTGLKIGETTITATSIDGQYTDTCTLTVGDYIPVEEVILDIDDTQSLSTNAEIFTIQAHVYPENASYPDLNYELVNDNDVLLLDGELVMACKKGIEVVKVSSKDNPSAYKLITFSVDGAVPTQTVSLDLSKITGGSSGSGTSFTSTTNGFYITVDKSYGSGTEIRNYSGSITISSSDKNITKIIYSVDSSSSYDGDPVSTSTSGYNVSLEPGAIKKVIVSGDSSKSVSIKAGKQMRISAIEIEYYIPGSTVKTLDSISISGQTTSLTVNSQFKFGGTVTAHYSDSSEANVTNLTTFSGYDMSVVGNYTVTASYTENGITKSATYSLNITSSSGGSYYDSITATSDLALLGQLHDLTCTKHTYYNGYSSDLNETNYFKTEPYNSSSSYLRDFYSGGQMKNEIVSSGSNGWNREHVWPKSLSGGLYVQTGAGADIQHLRPTIAQINSDRASKKYGVITGTKTTSSYSYNGTTYTGGYYTTSVFEPINEKKGDVARIIMYLYMHYNTYSNFRDEDTTYATTNGSGLSSYFGTLKFTNVMNAANEAAAIELLLDWNTSDPVDDIERTRNTEAAKITGARNPFIDNEGYADAIWGEEPVPTKSLTSISVSENHRDFAFDASFVKETVTAHYSDFSTADVTNSAEFSGYNMKKAGEQEITVSYTENNVTEEETYIITVGQPEVTELTLNKYNASIDAYKSEETTITANVTGQTGADLTVHWTTINNEGVISLNAETGNSVTVTALKKGSAKVKATAGSITKECSINVTDSSPILVESVNISGSDELLEGTSTTISATVLPTNATNSSVSWSSSNSNITIKDNGDNTATVTAPEGSHGQTTTITATANDGSEISDTLIITITEDVTVTSISIQYSGVDGENKVPFARFKANTDLDASVIAQLSNGKTSDITSEVTKNFKINYLKLGKQTITANYPGLPQAKLDVIVTNKGSDAYVGVSSKATRAGGEYNATPTEQATAWANYFIEVTGGGTFDGPCKLPEDQRAGALDKVWGDVKQEYGWMVAASKDVFCSKTASTLLSEAYEHYRYICVTYGLEQFVTNGSDEKPNLNESRSLFRDTFDSSTITVVAICLAGLVAVGFYFVYRKRREI